MDRQDFFDESGNDPDEDDNLEAFPGRPEEVAFDTRVSILDISILEF